MKKVLLVMLVILMAAPAWSKVIYMDEFETLGHFIFPPHVRDEGSAEAVWADVTGVPNGHGPEAEGGVGKTVPARSQVLRGDYLQPSD